MFLSALVILAHLAIKSYDLVVALTGGGPGYATELPATFMYAHTFTRNQLGMGAASAVMMLLTVVAIIVPYLYSEMRARTAHCTETRQWHSLGHAADAQGSSVALVALRHLRRCWSSSR